MSHICEPNSAGCPGCAREYYEDRSGFTPGVVVDLRPPFISDSELRESASKDDLIAAIVNDRIDDIAEGRTSKWTAIRPNPGFVVIERKKMESILDSHISDEALERIKTEFAKAIKDSANSWKVPIYANPDDETSYFVDGSIQVVMRNGAPVAVYTTRKGSTEREDVIDKVEEYFERPVLFGVWQCFDEDCLEDLPWHGFIATEVWVSRCDGFREGPEE